MDKLQIIAIKMVIANKIQINVNGKNLIMNYSKI